MSTKSKGENEQVRRPLAINRREAIGVLGGSFLLAGCGQALVNAASDAGSDSAAADAATAPSDLAAAAGDLATTTTLDLSSACTLSAEQEEGPFYVVYGMIRSDVRETQTGVALTLEITVIDVTTCLPIAGAAVDIWNASAEGVYSDEAQESTTGQSWLRGLQLTDANGQVTFTTIYPGWYAGRANHVHAKVHIGGTTSGSAYSDGSGHVCHTGQMFFPQAQNDAIKLIAPYTSNTNTYVTNAQDRVYTQQNGTGATLTLTGTPAAGITGTILLTLDPTATPSGP